MDYNDVAEQWCDIETQSEENPEFLSEHVPDEHSYFIPRNSSSATGQLLVKEQIRPKELPSDIASDMSTWLSDDGLEDNQSTDLLLSSSEDFPPLLDLEEEQVAQPGTSQQPSSFIDLSCTKELSYEQRISVS